MCLTKEEGAMGFKNLHAYNLAMLAKQGWRLISNPTSLIARLYKAIYFPRGSFLTAEKGEAPSFSWKSILDAKHILQAGLLWKINSGAQVNIWEDAWIPSIPARSLWKPIDCIFNTVSDLIHSDTRTWNVQALNLLFPSDIVETILCIPLRFRCSRLLVIELLGGLIRKAYFQSRLVIDFLVTMC